ncbi:AraC family transcriptional regulator [Saccharicrinis sp. FJH62]|uniref:AraC family transcriptional regulator n=1 Tax=Saccharicrinis sp. FJH62 TaxID=3344657 RepID=UPI0035D510DE
MNIDNYYPVFELFYPIFVLHQLLKVIKVMKAVRFIIPKTSTNSFRVQLDKQPYFYDTIHYHPEHQITYIVKGEGTCFIGNHVERFTAGDVYFIGKNVPHVFKSDKAYYEGTNGKTSFGISIFLKDETFGQQFFEIPEMAHIKRLLDIASMGVKLSGDDKEKVAQLIFTTKDMNGFQRFQALMEILDLFAQSDHLEILSSVRFDVPSRDSDHERINVVFNYLSGNFTQEISLDKISSIANMTPNAFCRYFKNRTGKTFSNFLNEIRVEYAGRMISGSHDSFGNIALESGFNNISYFNRKFKQITGLTPLIYRRKFGREG